MFRLVRVGVKRIPLSVGRVAILSGLTLAACFWTGTAVGRETADKDRPNVLVLHTDEHNFRTLGCYRALLPKEQAFIWGDGVAVETPHLDSIAKRGVICDRFYAAAPVCTPSRASFLTGRYPQNTGADSNDKPMLGDMRTFGQTLRRNGYATGYAGKWHVDGPAKPGWAPARKFGFDDNQYMFNRGHWKKLEDGPDGPRVMGGNSYNVAGADEKSFTTDFLAGKTIDFIRTHARGPFCFMVSFPDPHGPNSVRPPYDSMYAGLKFEQPRSAFNRGENLPLCALPPERPHLENMARYFGMVKCIDDNVGRILAALKTQGILDNTIVVFTSDHGDMCGEHGRVNKGIPLEGSARIPFLIAWPGRIKPGTVVHEALATVDFKPTLLGLLGMPRDPQDEGRDASSLLLTGQSPAGWKNVAISRHSGGNWLMAVSSRHKLIVSTDSDPCLFDLDRDPFETQNILASPDLRPVVRELAQALVDYAKRCKEPHAAQPAIQADLTWCVGGQGPYKAPNREAPAKPRRKAAKGGDSDDDT